MRVPLGVDRHHLRIAPERDRRCRGAVPQVRQRDDPARRLRGDPQQPGDRRLRARRPARGGPSRRRGAGGGDDRSRGGGPLVTMTEYVDVIVPRGGKGLIERMTREAKRAGDQAPRRRVPRLHRRRAPISTRPSASPTTRRRSATAVQHDGDAARARARSRRRSCPRSPRSTSTKGVEMRGDERARALVPAMKAADRGRLVHRVPGADPRRSASSTRSTRRSRTSRSTARSTPTRSSPRTTAARCASCAKSIRAR